MKLVAGPEDVVESPERPARRSLDRGWSRTLGSGLVMVSISGFMAALISEGGEWEGEERPVSPPLARSG